MPNNRARSRSYTMRARQESVDETRLRITEATVRLHERVGPAATTVSAIAAEAGVTRLTVYRHFPDDAALITACSGHWRALHPRPDATRWTVIDDPVERLRFALSESYSWSRTAAPMTMMILRDLESLPTFVGELLAQDERSRVTILMTGFGARGAAVRRLRVALRHALDIRTWHALCVDGDLDTDEAIDLLVGMVLAAVDPPPKGRAG